MMNMRLAPKMCGCGVMALTAAMLFAQDGAKKTVNVVGLEDDTDNAVVEAPAELRVKKPAAVELDADAINKAAKTLDADALMKKAAAESKAAPEAKAAANAQVKSLTIEGVIIPPSVELAKTLEDAVRHILRDAGRQIGTVSSNGIEKLTMPYQQLGDGKSYEIEWRKALRHLLSPVGYNFTEDGELVLFGLSAEVDVKHKLIAQERLLSNRTPILFTTSESEGGMELRNAIRDVSIKADVTITTDYMESSDLYVPVQAAAAEGTLTASELGKGKSAAPQVQVKRTKFDTNGQQIEWRTVLREILNPHDYDFVEMGGVVRIAKRAKIAQWEKEAIEKKPLAAKVIRLYHADPEAVVERVMKIKGILKHPNASLQATRKKDDSAETVKNLNARLQTGSGQRSGMSDTTSQVFDKLVRPRTIPAIVAYDIEENIAAIEEKVRLFDIKEKQILIEAIIFELDVNNGANGDMDGIKWEIGNGLGGMFTPLYGTVNNVGHATEQIFNGIMDGVREEGEFNDQGVLIKEGKLIAPGYGGGQLTDNNRLWMRTTGFDFKATIQLLRSRSNVKILSNPMIVVGDHSEAAIQVSNILPIPQIDANQLQSLSGSDLSQNSINIEWNMLRTGVLMWVCPEITENEEKVRLTVHPQVVTKGEKVDLSLLDTGKNDGGDQNIFKKYPVYNYELKMHEMDTRATVPSGATLMFGGLIDNQESEVEEKVRWLGDLPVIGWLFRSKTKVTTQKNLVIMIRPTILEDTDQTGFESPAIKEAEPLMENSGRDLKKADFGPHNVRELKKNVKEYYHKHVTEQLEGWGESSDETGEEPQDKPEVDPTGKPPVEEKPASSDDKVPEAKEAGK